jgi:hypothetical protein
MMVHEVVGSAVLAVALIGGGGAARQSTRWTRCGMEAGRKYVALAWALVRIRASHWHGRARGGDLLLEQCHMVRGNVAACTSAFVWMGQRDRGITLHHGCNALTQAGVVVCDGDVDWVGSAESALATLFLWG